MNSSLQLKRMKQTCSSPRRAHQMSCVAQICFCCMQGSSSVVTPAFPNPCQDFFFSSSRVHCSSSVRFPWGYPWSTCFTLCFVFVLFGVFCLFPILSMDCFQGNHYQTYKEEVECSFPQDMRSIVAIWDTILKSFCCLRQKDCLSFHISYSADPALHSWVRGRQRAGAGVYWLPVCCLNGIPSVAGFCWDIEKSPAILASGRNLLCN